MVPQYNVNYLKNTVNILNVYLNELLLEEYISVKMTVDMYAVEDLLKIY